MLFTSGGKNTLMSFFFRIGVSGFEKLKIKKINKTKRKQAYDVNVYVTLCCLHLKRKRQKQQQKLVCF